MKNNLLLALIFISASLNLNATTWLVGASQTYTMPSQVSTLVQNNDTVLIDAGIYNSDVAHWTANNLVLKGVNGLAHLKSNGLSWGDKAIWVIGGNNTTVEFIEFSLCTSTSQNGAGIRQEGLNLTVSHCYFHNNENGILAGALSPCTILVEYSEFNLNGYGDGYSHNLYIGHIDSLIFRYNYSHHCNIGHELKSRAEVNIILYNRITNEATGNASREIDLPNGGTSIIVGNIIEQGPNSQNSGIVGYGLEGLSNTSPDELYLVNNTVVNDRSAGTFVSIQNGTALYKAYNNIFAGPGTILNGTATSLDTSNNYYGSIVGAGFINATNYDYHLFPFASPVGNATNPGMAGTFSLTPTLEYAHPTNNSVRPISGGMDIGAYEYDNTMSILSFQQNKTFSIFPNPSSGIFYFDPNGISSKVEMYNSFGKLVLVMETQNRITFNESGLADGIYFLKISQGNNSFIEKIVLQK